MEIRHVLRTLVRRRWLIVAVFVPALLVTELFTLTQSPVYEATGTYVLKLTAAEDPVTAIDILSRRPEIATTFAEAAGSRLLRRRAADALGLTVDEQGAIAISSRLIAGTNILEISAQGADPQLLATFIDVLGRKTIDYVEGLYGAFSLEPLDDALVPKNPIRPNPLLNLALGGLVGLALGIGLAFAFGALEPTVMPPSSTMIDEESGAYSAEFFAERLRQEAARAKRRRTKVTVVALEVDRDSALETAAADDRTAVLRRVNALAASTLRDDDVVARDGDTSFLCLLADRTVKSARADVERLCKAIEATSMDLEAAGLTIHLRTAAGMGQGTVTDTLQTEAGQALDAALEDPSQRIRSFADLAPAT
jgi:protein tyrosine kinase modulator